MAQGGFGRPLNAILKDYDASEVPIGPVIDLARAWPDPKYMALGPIGQVASIPGQIAGFSRWLGAHTPIDEAIMEIFKQIYLAYSGPEQIRQNDTGWLARGLGALGGAVLPGQQPRTQPGDISASRVGGFVGSAAIQEFQGGFTPPGQGYAQYEANRMSIEDQWKNSRGLSAAQNWVETLYRMDQMTEAERLEERDSLGYQMMTGTGDAVFSWYFAPDVLLAKGWKAFRNANITRSWQDHLDRVTEEARRRTGMELTAMDSGGGISGALNHQVVDAHGEELITVIPESQFAQWQNPHQVAIADADLNPLEPPVRPEFASTDPIANPTAELSYEELLGRFPDVNPLISPEAEAALAAAPPLDVRSSNWIPDDEAMQQYAAMTPDRRRRFLQTIDDLRLGASTDFEEAYRRQLEGSRAANLNRDGEIPLPGSAYSYAWFNEQTPADQSNFLRALDSYGSADVEGRLPSDDFLNEMEAWDNSMVEFSEPPSRWGETFDEVDFEDFHRMDQDEAREFIDDLDADAQSEFLEDYQVWVSEQRTVRLAPGMGTPRRVQPGQRVEPPAPRPMANLTEAIQRQRWGYTFEQFDGMTADEGADALRELGLDYGPEVRDDFLRYWAQWERTAHPERFRAEAARDSDPGRAVRGMVPLESDNFIWGPLGERQQIGFDELQPMTTQEFLSWERNLLETEGPDEVNRFHREWNEWMDTEYGVGMSPPGGISPEGRQLLGPEGVGPPRAPAFTRTSGSRTVSRDEPQIITDAVLAWEQQRIDDTVVAYRQMTYRQQTEFLLELNRIEDSWWGWNRRTVDGATGVPITVFLEELENRFPGEWRRRGMDNVQTRREEWSIEDDPLDAMSDAELEAHMRREYNSYIDDNNIRTDELTYDQFLEQVDPETPTMITNWHRYLNENGLTRADMSFDHYREMGRQYEHGPPGLSVDNAVLAAMEGNFFAAGDMYHAMGGLDADEVMERLANEDIGIAERFTDYVQTHGPRSRPNLRETLPSSEPTLEALPDDLVGDTQSTIETLFELVREGDMDAFSAQYANLSRGEQLRFNRVYDELYGHRASEGLFGAEENNIISTTRQQRRDAVVRRQQPEPISEEDAVPEPSRAPEITAIRQQRAQNMQHLNASVDNQDWEAAADMYYNHLDPQGRAEFRRIYNDMHGFRADEHMMEEIETFRVNVARGRSGRTLQGRNQLTETDLTRHRQQFVNGQVDRQQMQILARQYLDLTPESQEDFMAMLDALPSVGAAAGDEPIDEFERILEDLVRTRAGGTFGTPAAQRPGPRPVGEDRPGGFNGPQLGPEDVRGAGSNLTPEGGMADNEPLSLVDDLAFQQQWVDVEMSQDALDRIHGRAATHYDSYTYGTDAGAARVPDTEEYGGSPGGGLEEILGPELAAGLRSEAAAASETIRRRGMTPEQQMRGDAESLMAGADDLDARMAAALEGQLSPEDRVFVDEVAGELNPPLIGRRINAEHPVVLLSGSEEGEVMRYAAALYRQNPYDPPVIVRIRPDGLPVHFLDMHDPMRLDSRSGLPSDALLATEVAQIRPDNVVGIRHPSVEELQSETHYLETMHGEAAWIPGGRLHDRLYAPDGTPRDPASLVSWEEVRDLNTAAVNLYNENPELASRFLYRKATERQAGAVGGTRLESLMDTANTRLVQNLLNEMQGLSPMEIRRRYLRSHPRGAIIADILGREATTPAEKRAVLLAAYGHDTPALHTMGPMARARMQNLTEDFGSEAGAGGLHRRYVRDIEEGMIASTSDTYVQDFIDAQSRHQAEIQDLARQVRLDNEMQVLLDMAPLQDMLRWSYRGRLRETIRTSNWYQNGGIGSRTVRAVVEHRPRQWLHLSDPQGDGQVRRQLEEASPLGVTDADVTHYTERYMAAENEIQRALIAMEAEGFIMEKARLASGLSQSQWDKVLSAQAQGRRGVSDFLKSARYDGKGRDILTWLDPETGHVIEWSAPMIASQNRPYIPLTDVRALMRAAKRTNELISVGRTVGTEVMDSFYHIWKPSVLLRGGWPVRVVGDEQLRLLARTGSLLEMIAALSVGEKIPLIPGSFQGLPLGEKIGRIASAPVIGVVRAIEGSATQLGRAAEKLGLLDPEFMRLLREAGVEPLASARAGYGGAAENTLREFEAILGRSQAGIFDHLTTKGTGQWSVFTQHDPGYGGAWLRVLKEQIAKDDFAKELLTLVKANTDNGLHPLDGVLERGVSWLNAHPEYTARLPWQRDFESWTDNVLGMIQDYTANFDTSLTGRILSGRINGDDLQRVNSIRRPETVHAEIVAQTTGNSEIVKFVRDIVATGYDSLGRFPTDTLSRQPFFRWSYADEMRRLGRVAEREGRELTVEAVGRMDAAARHHALNEVKTYLYDLAETSRFGDMFRFFFPFLPAWQEVLTVWSKLAKRSPEVIPRGLQVWNAPDKAGMVVTDEEGDEYIQFVMSDRMADKLNLTGWSRYLATGGMRFAKDSFNMITNNPLPSFGPPIQIPVNEIVLRKPELEDALRFILPMGARSGSSFFDRAGNIIASPILQRGEAFVTGLSGDQVYQRYFVDALTWLDYRYRAGISETPPTLDEVHRIAGALFNVRTVFNLFSPAQPIFNSPLKPYIDAYRDLVDLYGQEEADAMFLDNFGPELFSITVSRTVTHTGIPATVEAELAREQYETLITKYPEYGRLIIGEDNAVGEFSTAAFAAQLSRQLNPDDPFSDTERAYREVELTENGSIREVDERLGWIEYIKAVDGIEAVRRARGLPNLRVAAAQDLVDLKEAITQNLAEKYPAWWEEFNLRDDLKWQKQTDALRAISNSPLITGDETRQDFDGVRAYFSYRDLILQELNTRRQIGGSSTLDSVANQDLAVLWESLIYQLLTDNVAFAPIYFRYLEGDPVRLK